MEWFIFLWIVFGLLMVAVLIKLLWPLIVLVILYISIDHWISKE